jgi:hypothetical protein
MGYHKQEIFKGILGDSSKIREEFEEFLDAVEQENPILELCELADLLGAIEAYSIKKYNISLIEIYRMTEATVSAFKEGER